MSIIGFQSAANGLRGQSRNALTPTEVRILELAGLAAPEIALSLGIAYGTVRTHQKSIRLKLGAETWTQAALIYDRQQRRAA